MLVDNRGFQKHTSTHRPVCALSCALSTDGASVKDTNESNETEGKTAPEIYTTVKHLRETEREQWELGGGGRGEVGRGFRRQTAEREKRKKEEIKIV